MAARETTSRRVDEPRRAMHGAYDEVDLEDMEWSEELEAFTYQCPGGGFFQITREELRRGDGVAHCPLC